MTFRHDKTGQHLRAHVLNAGEQERMRAMQCLNQCYGTGSRAALSKMLLATLGSVASSGNIGDQDTEQFLPSDNMPSLGTSQVAEPLEKSANGAKYVLPVASSGN